MTEPKVSCLVTDNSLKMAKSLVARCATTHSLSFGNYCDSFWAVVNVTSVQKAICLRFTLVLLKSSLWHWGFFIFS